MNIIRENKGDLNVSLKIQIDEADYSAKVDQTLKEYRRKANIPGFRPGMVPASLVKKMYGKSIAADEINKLISESIEQYIESEKLQILGHPLPNYDLNQPMDLDNQSTFEFSVDLGLAPEVEVNLSGFTVERTIIKATDEQIDSAIEQQTIRQGMIADVEVSEPNDRLFGSFHQLDDEGVIIDGGLHSSRSFQTTDITHEESLKQFIGVKKGDVVVFNPLKAFGNQEKAARLMSLKTSDLDNITSNFSFEVESISRNTPHPVNEAFYKLLFPNQEISDEQSFREAIGQVVATEMQPQADEYFFSDAVLKIIRNNQFALPTEFLRRFAEATLTDEKSIKTDEEFTKFLDGIRWELIQNKLIEEHKITVEEAEVRSHTANYLINNYFQFMRGIENAEENEYIRTSIDKILGDKEQARKIVDRVLEEKILHLFIEKLAIKEKHRTFNEFIEDLNSNKTQKEE